MRHSLDARFKMKKAKEGRYFGSSNPMYGRKQSEAARRAIGAAKKDTKWIRQAEKTMMVKKEELESYILSGWELGRVMSRRRIQS